MFVDILILGAGPTGLGAAYQLAQNHHDCNWLLVDAMDRPGGMACTEVDDKGFRWDLGGHVIHSHFDAFNKAISMHQDWVFPRRGGWARVQDGWCPTPVQRHLGNLKDGQTVRDELVLLHAEQLASPSSSKSTPQNLGQYYRATFGSKLDDVFFSPFNFKQWAWPLAKLDHSWTSLRSGSKSANVPAPSTDLRPSSQPDDTSIFPYPRLGTGSLWTSIAASLPKERQLYNTKVVAIDLESRQARLSNGNVISYGRCVSSLPMNVAIDLINAEEPSSIVPAAVNSALKHSSTTITGLGFEGPVPEVLKGKTWIFAADEDVLFHRATIITNFSESMSGDAAEGHALPRWSIMFETSSSEHRANVDISTEALARAHLAELRRWGAVAAEQEPISIWHKHLVLGYPIPFLGRDALLSGDASSTKQQGDAAGLLARLEAHSFVSRGRFGGWRYESSNQDYAFMQGIEAIDLIFDGQKEHVFWPTRPDAVCLPELTVPSLTPLLTPRSASKLLPSPRITTTSLPLTCRALPIAPLQQGLSERA